jgi:hypothetical protein
MQIDRIDHLVICPIIWFWLTTDDAVHDLKACPILPSNLSTCRE